MPPLFYAILVSLSLICALRAWDSTSPAGRYTATRRQRRAWHRERLEAGWRRARN